MEWVFWIVLLGTTTWVAVDASKLRARRGLLGGGFFDMGVAEWGFSCLLLWLVAFPAYLLSRPRYVQLNRAAEGVTLVSQGAPMVWPPAPPLVPGVFVDDLARLISLRDAGAITPAEFDVLRGSARDPRAPW